MKTSTQIIEESGFGVGYDSEHNELKRQLAMGADIILEQERHNPTSDRALATTMALCSLVNSRAQIGVMAKSGINPFQLLKEKRDVLTGATMLAMAKFSAQYGSGETRETFLAWKASGCPTGAAYVSWLSAPAATAGLRPYQSAMGADLTTIARGMPLPIDGFNPLTESITSVQQAPPIQMHVSPAAPPPTTVKLTASAAAIAKAFGRDPAEVAAWRADNTP